MNQYPFAHWREIARAIDMPADAVKVAEPIVPIFLENERFSLIALTEAVRENKHKAQTFEMIYAMCDRQRSEHTRGGIAYRALFPRGLRGAWTVGRDLYRFHARH